MGPLEHARAPDEEPMEPHGASKGSRSKANGPLEQEGVPKSRASTIPLETTMGPLGQAWPQIKIQ